jgi:hypothetical protein
MRRIKRVLLFLILVPVFGMAQSAQDSVRAGEKLDQEAPRERRSLAE